MDEDELRVDIPRAMLDAEGRTMRHLICISAVIKVRQNACGRTAVKLFTQAVAQYRECRFHMDAFAQQYGKVGSYPT